MKKYLIGAAIGAFLVAFFGHFYVNCRTGSLAKESKAWQEAYQAEKIDSATKIASSNRRIEELLEHIGGLQGNIDSLMFANAGLEEDLAASRRSEAEAAAEVRELKTAEVQELLERYPALKAYDLAKDRLIEFKDRIIFTLTQERDNYKEAFLNSEQKYQGQVRISEEYKGQLVDTQALLRKVELRLNLQDKRVAWLEILGAWKTYGIVAIGIVGAAAIIF